jgi:SAM-dependent methyltransferase
MKSALSLVVCPRCKSDFSERDDLTWKCGACGFEIKVQENMLLFTSIPDAIQPFEKRERGVEKGTPWRQANWRFLEKQVEALPQDAVILDVGAGHGDFSELFEKRGALYLDVFPYPEVDLVCDLTQVVPFRKDSIEAIALVNVLEHVYNGNELISIMAEILKPGGLLWVTVPFLLKIHQEPYDFFRCTSHALERMGSAVGLQVERIEGYYDPMFLIGESLRNIEYRVLPDFNRMKRYLMRVILNLVRVPVYLLGSQIGKGAAKEVDHQSNPAPVGYQIVFRKPVN